MIAYGRVSWEAGDTAIGRGHASCMMLLGQGARKGHVRGQGPRQGMRGRGHEAADKDTRSRRHSRGHGRHLQGRGHNLYMVHGRKSQGRAHGAIHDSSRTSSATLMSDDPPHSVALEAQNTMHHP